MKYGKVLTYKDAEEAKKLIGKKVIARDVIASIEKHPECWDVGILHDFECDLYYPFNVNGYNFQFIREVIEEPELMTNGQLAEWCAKGNGEYLSIGHYNNAFSSYSYIAELKNTPVLIDTRIRTWDSEEWVIPTVDIYERDCR